MNWQDCLKRFECPNYPTHCEGCMDLLERGMNCERLADLAQELRRESPPPSGGFAATPRRRGSFVLQPES